MHIENTGRSLEPTPRNIVLNNDLNNVEYGG